MTPETDATQQPLGELFKLEITKYVVQHKMDPDQQLQFYRLLVAFSNLYVARRKRSELQISSQSFSDVPQHMTQYYLGFFNLKILGIVHARHTQSQEKCALALDGELMPFVLSERAALLRQALEFKKTPRPRRISTERDEI